ncbi:MAG: hypothetical protein AAFO91_11670 [Bacteroidota bacterium]
MNKIKIAFAGSILLMIILVAKYFQKRNSLYANSKFTTGEYINYNVGVKTGGGLKFSYLIDGEAYEDICCQHLPTKCERYLMGNEDALRQYTFPVAYDATDPSNAELLVVQSQYDRYELDVPDEIEEIIRIISTCE